MPRSYRVAVRIDQQYRRVVKGRAIASLVRRVLAAEGVPAPTEVSVFVTDDATVQGLNSRYLGENEPTDVLSFPLSDATSYDGFVHPPGMTRCLGEVIISYPTAERQAGEQGHAVEAEVAHLLVHGVLHILGYDHAEPEEQQRMRLREEELLEGLVH